MARQLYCKKEIFIFELQVALKSFLFVSAIFWRNNFSLLALIQRSYGYIYSYFDKKKAHELITNPTLHVLKIRANNIGYFFCKF